MIKINQKQDACIDYSYIHNNELVDDFKNDIKKGLLNKNKSLPCKYIYDEKGSCLFQQICMLDDYYLTDCEIEILENNKEYFKEFFKNKKFSLIELGPGDGHKTKILIKHFLDNNLNFQYIPIDISSSAIDDLVNVLKNEFSNIKINGLIAEYFHGLDFSSEISDGIKVVLFLGSNIGNMNFDQSNNFLKNIWNSLNNKDYLLIGFDLKKDLEIIMKAYDDSKGITSDFHKNLLNRINNELGGSFDPDLFNYKCLYDDKYGAIKSYLISTIDQDVYIKELDQFISFEKEEVIHTESSYKYDESIIKEMAERNGFKIIKNFYDKRKFFTDSLWQVVK